MSPLAPAARTSDPFDSGALWRAHHCRYVLARRPQWGDNAGLTWCEGGRRHPAAAGDINATRAGPAEKEKWGDNAGLTWFESG